MKFIIKAVGMRSYWCDYGYATLGGEWGDDIAYARRFDSETAARRFLDNSRLGFECEVIPTP